MKDATLAQGNQVLTLILQHEIPTTQLQAVIESGLLTDLLTGNVAEVDRNAFRVMLGFTPWGTVELCELDSPVPHMCAGRHLAGCQGDATLKYVGTVKSGKGAVSISCCANEACKKEAKRRAESYLLGE